MALHNEKELMNALDVSSLRGLSMDKVTELARMVRSGDVDGDLLPLLFSQVPGLSDNTALLTESADKTEQRVFSRTTPPCPR